MPSPSDRPRPGLYELLLTERIQAALRESAAAHDRQPLGKSAAARTLARHLADFLTRALDTIPDDDRPQAQVAIANALIDQLATPLAKFVTIPDDRILPEVLRSIAPQTDRNVLTTTYRGVTQARVIEDLIDKGAEVRIAYRTDATRLHAKAWLFHLDSGFSTAYIGSSNLSRSAL